jgi:pimeloyl-ACP methyl ester carboxylesterase
MRFVLDSGRRIAVHLTSTRALWPAADERLIVFCHSAPGAGSFDPDPALTKASRATLLSVNRPGYGRSDPVAAGRWATVASAADDIAAVLENVGVEQVGVVGWSAGGRVALALAARRPDLVDRVAVIATPAPDNEVAWIDPRQREQLERLRSLACEEAHAELASSIAALIPSDPFSDDALWLLAAEGTSDKAALRSPAVRNRLGEMLGAAFAQGAVGLAADIAGYCLQPWGFEPEAVEAKTLLLYGSRDAVAGPAHARWWLERLPNARLEVAHDAGHLVLLPTWSRVLSHLTPDRVVSAFPDRRSTTDFEEFPAA